MRQLKNCRKGRFVKYKGVLYQVNCFHGKQVTLVEVKDSSDCKIIWPDVTEKVEYLGMCAKDENGKLWISKYY